MSTELKHIRELLNLLNRHSELQTGEQSAHMHTDCIDLIGDTIALLISQLDALLMPNGLTLTYALAHGYFIVAIKER